MTWLITATGQTVDLAWLDAGPDPDWCARGLPHLATAQHRAERLGETLRLATAIADDSARCDIECHCVAERMGQHTWYDTRPGATPDGADNADLVATALRYLRLREHVVTHPAQAHLVRFER